MCSSNQPAYCTGPAPRPKQRVAPQRLGVYFDMGRTISVPPTRLLAGHAPSGRGPRWRAASARHDALVIDFRSPGRDRRGGVALPESRRRGSAQGHLTACRWERQPMPYTLPVTAPASASAPASRARMRPSRLCEAPLRPQLHRHPVEYVDRMPGSLKTANRREGVTSRLRAAE